jgi:predicted amidophosphoribosyltransferase
LRERGFNQSLELARQLGRGLRMPVATDLVHRTRLTPSQQGLNARQRRRNLRGAFVLNPSPRFAGVQSVALVDDVVTTMSTVRELARVLRLQHPELAIHAWCVARA